MFLTDVLDIGDESPLEISKSKFFEPHGIAIFRTKLGHNHTGGLDYWVTIRAFGDKLGKDAQFIGAVMDEKVKVGDYLSVEAVEHIQDCVVQAFINYENARREEFDAQMDGGLQVPCESPPSVPPKAGPLHYLSPSFACRFEGKKRIWWSDAVGGCWVTVTHRYLLSYSKRQAVSLLHLE